MTDCPVALITGGGSGIGAATARRLLALGRRVTVTGRDEGRLRRFARSLGDPDGLPTIPADASDYDAVRSAVESTVREFGRLDTAVANAGFSTHDTLADGDPAAWREMVLMVTGDGVGVTLIAPGRVKTPFWDGRGALPEGDLLTSDQIADAVVWAVGQPDGVDVNTVVVRPLGQPH
ncbi:SDR family oxidoreductase [Microbispora sp. CA-135349]|uniref:SDR family oxidoreductase n=1 Tax=Microbispora sp. CA-135349 TaxID=3239953 RepID=UPI003D8C65A5